MSITLQKKINFDGDWRGRSNDSKCTISYDKKYIALSGWKFISLYNIMDNITTYISGNVSSNAIKFSHDNNQLAFISYEDNEHKLYLYSIVDKTKVNVLNNCLCMEFSNDDNFLIIGLRSKEIVFYNMDSKLVQNTFKITFEPHHIYQYNNSVYCFHCSRKFMVINLDTMKQCIKKYPTIKNFNHYPNPFYWQQIYYKDKIAFESHYYGYAYLEIHDISNKNTYFKDLTQNKILGGFIIRGLEFINDDIIAYDGDCDSVNLWNYKNDTIRSIPFETNCYSLCHIDNRIIFIKNSKLCLWNTDTNKMIISNESTGGSEYCYKLDDNTIITNDEDKSIMIWKII